MFLETLGVGLIIPLVVILTKGELITQYPLILVIINAMRGQPKFGLRCLISTMALIKSLLGPLGPGLLLP